MYLVVSSNLTFETVSHSVEIKHLGRISMPVFMII